MLRDRWGPTGWRLCPDCVIDDVACTVCSGQRAIYWSDRNDKWVGIQWQYASEYDSPTSVDKVRWCLTCGGTGKLVRRPGAS